MARQHHYAAHLRWTGAAEGPTTDYRSYSRRYEVQIEGKPPLQGSADPMFRGEGSLYNPEDLLLAALSACHMLSYLAVCAFEEISVLDYEDEPTGTMVLEHRRGHFTEVVLRPRVTIATGSDPERAQSAHDDAHAGCFIARSVSFPVRHEAHIEVASG